MRTAVAIFCCLLVAYACARTARSAATTWMLVLGFHPGERMWERTYEVDRVDWKLPEHRMEHFRAAGVIINEEQHLTTTIDATVASLIRDVAVLQGEATIVSVDVPRHHTQTSRTSFSAAIAPNNVPVPSSRLQIEDAAMAGLPQNFLALGGRWSTHLPVDTTLGSGTADFEHTLVGVDNGLLEISVRGQGQITGAQYHLPKLLPGTIELSGAAWYDPTAKLVVRESYEIHNRLIKPMEGEDSGFDERLSVDTSMRILKP